MSSPYSTELDHVFGLKPAKNSNYVHRQADEELLESLVRNKHVSIYGCSKQGKSSLRIKNLSPSEYIMISCQRGSSISDLNAALLRCAGYQVVNQVQEERGEKESVKLSLLARFGVPLTGHAQAATTAETQTAERMLETKSMIPIDLSDCNSVADALAEATEKRVVVVEEFHYLPQETQKIFSSHLKYYLEETDFKFVIVGVWLENNRLSVLNADLAGRISSINADIWTEEKLLEVIEQGCGLLNVTLDDAFSRRLIAESAHSVFIVREVLYKICEENGVLHRQEKERRLTTKVRPRAYITNVIAEFDNYESIILNFARTISSTTGSGFSDEKRIFDFLVKSSSRDMGQGFSLAKIQRGLLSQGSNYSYSVPIIVRAIARLEGMQNSLEFSNIFEYDRVQRKLNFIDRGFLLWRKGKKLKDVSELIFVEDTIN